MWWTPGRTAEKAGICYSLSRNRGRTFAPRKRVDAARGPWILHSYLGLDSEFRLATLDGRPLGLGDVRGQPLVLSFFASWCDPCRAESGVVKAMAEAGASDGHAAVGIAVQDEREALVRFLREEGLALPVAMDPDSCVARAYRVVGPPTTVFMDAQGVVRDVFVGPLTAERAQQGLARARGAAGDGRGETLAASGAALLLALGAGLLSFLSPCVLPLLPAYLGYVTGLSAERLGQAGATPGQRRRAASRTVAFAAGLALAFVALGASASLVGEWLAAYRSVLSRVAGLVVLAFGLHLLGVLLIGVLYREFRPALHARAASGGVLQAAALGAAFAVGWTPCIGPMLGGILLVASQAEGVQSGGLLLLAYGAGLGVPFVLAGLATRWALGAVALARRHAGLVEKMSGGLLAGTGLLLVSGRVSQLGVWLQRLL